MINALGKLENISTLVFSAFLRACMLSSRYLLQTTSSEAARFCLREWTSGYTPRLDYLHVKAHLLQSFSLLRLRPYCHQVVPLWQIPVPARTRRLASEYSHQQRPRSVFGPESRSDVPWLQALSVKVVQFRFRVWRIMHEFDGQERGTWKGKISKDQLSRTSD
jgi:hypothetical protein